MKSAQDIGRCALHETVDARGISSCFESWVPRRSGSSGSFASCMMQWTRRGIYPAKKSSWNAYQALPPATLMSSQPCGVTVAASPGRSSTVVIADSMIAGPAMVCAGASASKA